MIRAGVRLYKWCAECGKVTEHGEGAALGMTVQFCKAHDIKPWEIAFPMIPIRYLLGIEGLPIPLDMPNK